MGERKVKPRRVPDLAEHTDEVLAAHGFAPVEIDRLRQIGAIG